MSDEDIDKAVKEAAEYEAQDKKRKEAMQIQWYSRHRKP